MPIRAAKQLAIKPTAKPAPPPGAEETIPVGQNIGPLAPYVAQELHNGCWSACARMVLNSEPINAGIELTELQVYQIAGLNPNANDGAGDTAGVDKMVKLYRDGGLGVVINCVDRPENFGSPFVAGDHLTEDALDDELLAKRPVQMGILFDEGGGHVVMIVGAEFDADGEKRYLVHDPEPKLGRGRAGFDGLVGYAPFVDGRQLHGRWSVSIGRFSR